jgi:hypothetical protein
MLLYKLGIYPNLISKRYDSLDVLIYIFIAVFGLVVLFAYEKLVARFFTKIDKANLGKIFWMPPLYLLASCSALILVSLFGVYTLVNACGFSTNSAGIYTAAWECSKLAFADRGNLAVICFGPWMVITVFLAVFFKRLFGVYRAVIAFEIVVYSIVFILLLPVILLPRFFHSLGPSREQVEKDNETRRQAQIAHEEIHGKNYW